MGKKRKNWVDHKGNKAWKVKIAKGFSKSGGLSFLERNTSCLKYKRLKKKNTIA